MSSYGPQEDKQSIFLEKIIIGGYLIICIGYGVQLVLYITGVLHLWRQHKRRAKVTRFLLAYITMLFILESLLVSSSTWTIEGAYVNNRNFPGGPLAYIISATNQPTPEYVILVASLVSLTFLSDLLVLWRCWVIWTPSGKPTTYTILTFPTLLLLASLLLGTLWALKTNQSSHDDDPLFTALGIAYYLTSVGVNILVTALIILRIIFYRRLLLESLPPEHAKGYFSAATILIESAALYSVFALACVVSMACHNPISRIFIVLSSASQQIAGYLIILRVAQGRAWNSTTLAKADDTQFTTIRSRQSV